MKIAITTDHTGLAYTGLFAALQQHLESLGHVCTSFAPATLDMGDDYPDFIFPAAQAIAAGTCDAGIIMGGSGQGEAMAANRIRGVRCALFYGPAVARSPVDAEGTKDTDPFEILKLSRQHNHANMLSLAARFLSETEMKHAVEVWLSAPYSTAERHVRRVRKLDKEL